MNIQTVVELLSLYLQQTYKAQLDSVFTNESKLGFSYSIIRFTYRNEKFEIKVFAPDFILTKKLDFPGKVSDNIIDARKQIDSILKQL
jgi:hypothetical protein